MTTLMPPTAIQRHVDGRWRFENYFNGPDNIREYTEGTISFHVKEGVLVDGVNALGKPAPYYRGGSHDLSHAIYLGVTLVHVEFV